MALQNKTSYTTDLAEKLSALDITSYDLEALETSPGSMLDSIKKLKRGKSDGGGLLSDHLIYSPCSFATLLVPIITPLLRHGYMPLVLVMHLSSLLLKATIKIPLFLVPTVASH